METVVDAQKDARVFSGRDHGWQSLLDVAMGFSTITCSPPWRLWRIRHASVRQGNVNEIDAVVAGDLVNGVVSVDRVLRKAVLLRPGFALGGWTASDYPRDPYIGSGSDLGGDASSGVAA